ncbi:MAG: YfhO family protein [Vicinamibacteria bacterium]|nr:YfhO family protein [Vicinamibacteria bacterium]
MPSLSRREVVLLGFFCLIPLLNFPMALVSDRTLFARDIGMVWAPQVEAVVQQLAKGQPPFFDARRGFGQPLFADPRAEVLYPPAWIHWILPMETSYPLFCAAHLILAALGAARLARRLMPGASRSAELTAGFIYAAGGPLLSLVSHWHHLAAAAWMPWILERAEGQPNGRTAWISLPLLVAMQTLAGSPDYAFLTFILCFLRLVTRGDQSAARSGRVVAALALGILLAAVQLLPSLAFAHAAARDPRPIGWAISPLHPALTIETMLPVRVETWPLRPDMRNTLLYSAQVWMFSHYLGLSAWALALLAIPAAAPATRRFAIGSVLIGLVFAWGVRSEALQEVVGRIPLVSGLRFPTKHLAAASLGLSLLAAGAVGRAASWTSSAKRLVLSGSLLAFLACVLLFRGAAYEGSSFDSNALIRPSLALGALLGILGLGGAASKAWLLPVLVALDLLGGNSSLNPTTPSAFFRNRPPLSAVIPEGSRLYTSDYSIQLKDPPTRPPEGAPYALARAPRGFSRDETLALAATWYLNPPSAARFGYFGSFDLDVLDFYRAPLKASIRAFVTSRDPAFVHDRLRRGSVDFVVTMDPPPLWSSLPLVTQEQNFFETPVRVYRVTSPWPRVRLEAEDGSLLSPAPRVLEYLDGHVRAEVDAPEGANLVVATAWDAGWRATVDGVPAALRENAMAFASVPLKAGHHRIELSYRPPLFLEGAALSTLSVLAMLGLAARKGG